MLSAVLTLSAQGEWKTVKTEADDLRGVKAGEMCICTEEGVGSFVVWDWKEPQFILVSDNGIFNINSGGWLEILIGFYNNEGVMIEKTKLWLSKEEGSGYKYARTISRGMIPPGQKKKVNRIFKALKSTDEYVRIVAPRYNTIDFDLKIPPYK